MSDDVKRSLERKNKRLNEHFKGIGDLSGKERKESEKLFKELVKEHEKADRLILELSRMIDQKEKLIKNQNLKCAKIEKKLHKLLWKLAIRK